MYIGKNMTNNSITKYLFPITVAPKIKNKTKNTPPNIKSNFKELLLSIKELHKI